MEENSLNAATSKAKKIANMATTIALVCHSIILLLSFCLELEYFLSLGEKTFLWKVEKFFSTCFKSLFGQGALTAAKSKAKRIANMATAIALVCHAIILLLPFCPKLEYFLSLGGKTLHWKEQILFYLS